jgi:CoA:oxalate CoA-transferase
VSQYTGALAGVRVLDCTHALAGPYAGMLLADLGADVVKVEQPDGGDRSRRNGPFVDGMSAKFGSVNRGKRSIVLDLKHPAGKDLALRLVDAADVLVQNFAPGVMDRLGLGYAALSERNPRLVYASCTGFGETGSYAKRLGVDPIIQAMSGAMSITGEPDGPPVRVGYSMCDLGGGMFLAMGVLGALYERERSGLGQFLDISLLECHLALLENAIVRHTVAGEVPSRLGSRHPYGDPLNHAYMTRDGAMIAGFSALDWTHICEALGHPEWLTDPVLGQPEANRAAVEAALKELLRSDDTRAWVARLEQAGVMCVPINSIAEALQETPVVEREFIQDTLDSQGRHMPMVASPLRLSRTPPRRGEGPPALGEHSQAILAEWLGLESGAFDDLEADGIFTPSTPRWNTNGKLPPRLAGWIG